MNSTKGEVAHKYVTKEENITAKMVKKWSQKTINTRETTRKKNCVSTTMEYFCSGFWSSLQSPKNNNGSNHVQKKLLGEMVNILVIVQV